MALQFVPEVVKRYTDKALAQFDFINLMSYDHMSGKRPAPHSSYADAHGSKSLLKAINETAHKMK